MDFDYILSAAAVITVTCCSKLLRRRKKRRWGVRPLNKNNRHEKGHYKSLIKFMIEHDHDQFFKYTRMVPEQYNYLLGLIQDTIEKTPGKGALSPSERLFITLHFLAEGCSMQQIAWDFYVGKTTVHLIIKETCTAIWDILQPIYLPPPTTASWIANAEAFYKRWNMPNCISALDGKHIYIQAPANSGSDYFNYKKTFSIVLLATCDAYYKFTLVDIGSSGSNHDSRVFRESGFGKAMLNNRLDIPANAPLPQTNIMFPYYFVADQAFPLSDHIMRPFPGENLDEGKLIFNYRLSRARRTIENTFGILVQRWRKLRYPIIANVDTAEQIVKAVVVLHNYLQKAEMDIPLDQRRYCPTGYADSMENGRIDNTNLRSIGRVGSNNPSREAQQLRSILTEYFQSSVGTFLHQYIHISRGLIPPP